MCSAKLDNSDVIRGCRRRLNNKHHDVVQNTHCFSLKNVFTKNYEISVQIKDNFMPSALRQTRPMPNFTSGAEIWDYSPETILSINLPELRIVCTISTKFSASFRFLPRDAMQAPKRGLCRHAVSVCVSVTFVHSVKTNKDIFEIFPLGSQATLVYFVPNGMAILQRNPPP